MILKPKIKLERVTDISVELLKKYNIKAIVCGSDFKFGKNAVGDVKTLEKLCSIYGISLNVVDCLYFENKKISSSTIRYLIETGEIEKANMLMNRHFCVSGTVKRGKSLAHKHNAPTINIDLKTNSVIPRYGVYACYRYCAGSAQDSRSVCKAYRR